MAARRGARVEPDQFADKGYYYRSDQFSLAKIGVPALYFDTGTEFVGRPAGWGKEQIEAWTEEKYHQPSDELEDDVELRGDGGGRPAGVLLSGLIMAEAEGMLDWVPGDEFEAAREEALAAVGMAGGSSGRGRGVGGLGW